MERSGLLRVNDAYGLSLVFLMENDEIHDSGWGYLGRTFLWGGGIDMMRMKKQL